MTTKQQRVVRFMLTNSRGTRWFFMAVPFLLTWGVMAIAYFWTPGVPKALVSLHPVILSVTGFFAFTSTVAGAYGIWHEVYTISDGWKE